MDLVFDGSADSNAVRGLVVNGFGAYGVRVTGTNFLLLECDFLGTNVAGDTRLKNGSGRDVSFDFLSGGTVRGNLIAGWVDLETSSGANVQDNFMGTDVTGLHALGAGGVTLYDSSFAMVSGNLINGGVGSYDASSASIYDNLCGADSTGEQELAGGSCSVSVGKALADISGNVMAACGLSCIEVGNGYLYADITDNFIGTDRTGTKPLGNAGDGIHLDSQSLGAIIRGNIIAFNQGDGISIVSDYTGDSSGHTISVNSIYSNGGLGINLIDRGAPDGVTPNDLADLDTGPNGLQNYPVLTSAEVYSGGVLLDGTLNSTPNRSFRLEFFANTACDPSGYGEGERFLCAAKVIADGDGNAGFHVPCQSQVPEGEFITATATDMTSGDTSEFSACRESVSLGAINDWLGQTHLQTVCNPADPRAARGVYTITATFQNTTALTLTNLSFKVTAIEYQRPPRIDPNLLLLNTAPRGLPGPGGVGSTLSVPGEVAPGGLFTARFAIGLPRREPFVFYVDAYAAPADGVTGASTQAIGQIASLRYELSDAQLTGDGNSTADNDLYLPWINR